MKRFQIICLNVFFYPLFIFVTLASVPMMGVVVIFLSIFRPLRVYKKNLRLAINVYGKIITRLPHPFSTFSVENRSGLDLLNGPFIFIFNHRSSSDPFFLSVIPIRCETIQVVNKWPFKLPVLGFVASLAGYLNVNEMPYEEFAMKCKEVLDEGVSIAFYPEGTRSGSRHMNPFYSSAFRVFLNTGAPIVPICVSGNEHMPHKGSLVLHPGHVKIRILKPVLREHYGESMSVFQIKNSVREVIKTELSKMDEAA